MMKNNKIRRCVGCGSSLEKRNEFMCLECASFIFKGKSLDEISKYQENGMKKAYPVWVD